MAWLALGLAWLGWLGWRGLPVHGGVGTTQNKIQQVFGLFGLAWLSWLGLAWLGWADIGGRDRENTNLHPARDMQCGGNDTN